MGTCRIVVICRCYLLAWPTFIYGLIWSVAMKGQFAVLRVSVYDSIYIQSVDREKWKVI